MTRANPAKIAYPASRTSAWTSFGAVGSGWVKRRKRVAEFACCVQRSRTGTSFNSRLRQTFSCFSVYNAKSVIYEISKACLMTYDKLGEPGAHWLNVLLQLSEGCSEKILGSSSGLRNADNGVVIDSFNVGSGLLAYIYCL